MRLKNIFECAFNARNVLEFSFLYYIVRLYCFVPIRHHTVKWLNFRCRHLPSFSCKWANWILLYLYVCEFTPWCKFISSYYVFLSELDPGYFTVDHRMMAELKMYFFRTVFVGKRMLYFPSIILTYNTGAGWYLLTIFLCYIHLDIHLYSNADITSISDLLLVRSSRGFMRSWKIRMFFVTFIFTWQFFKWSKIDPEVC